MAEIRSAITWEQRASYQQSPPGRPFFYQSWNNLLFIHWRYDPDEIQRRLPAGLKVDTYNESAWIAIVPFEMNRIRPVGMPALAWLSFFLELNVRTYVIDEQGTPGVWFFSLQANRRPAVVLGRTLYQLPYWWSAMRSVRDTDGWFDYQCRRFADPLQRNHRYRWRPHGDIAEARLQTFEFFVAERYVLFAQSRDGTIAKGRVHHPPYRLQNVEVDQCDSSLLALDNLTPSQSPPDHLAFCSGVDVSVYALTRSL